MPGACASPDRCGPAPGRLIVVLGPSGAGKDTLLSYARSRFHDNAEVMFARRAITRPSDAGSEDHLGMNDREFDAALDEGRFSLTWAANGLRYGLPRSIEAELASGKVVVVNGSRGAWDVIRKVFPGAMAVEIRVDPATLTRRLQARGRESDADIEARLARAAALDGEFEADVVIDNSGAVETAGSALADCIRKAIRACSGTAASARFHMPR